MTNPNTNCLEGIACPMCEQTKAFFIVASVRLHVTDYGTEDQGGDHTWDHDAPCECAECGYSRPLSSFYATDKIVPLPDEISITWHIMDVQEVRPDLTDAQAREALNLAKKCHDCNYGISWETLTACAQQLFGDEPDEAETAEEKGGVA